MPFRTEPAGRVDELDHADSRQVDPGKKDDGQVTVSTDMDR